MRSAATQQNNRHEHEVEFDTLQILDEEWQCHISGLAPRRRERNRLRSGGNEEERQPKELKFAECPQRGKGRSRPSGQCWTFTHPDAEFTCSSGNRVPDYALADWRLESVVTVEPCWAVPWKSRVALEIITLRAPRTHNETCVHPAEFTASITGAQLDWHDNWAVQVAPQEKAQNGQQQRMSSRKSACLAIPNLVLREARC